MHKRTTEAISAGPCPFQSLLGANRVTSVTMSESQRREKFPVMLCPDSPTLAQDRWSGSRHIYSKTTRSVDCRSGEFQFGGIGHVQLLQENQTTILL